MVKRAIAWCKHRELPMIILLALLIAHAVITA